MPQHVVVTISPSREHRSAVYPRGVSTGGCVEAEAGARSVLLGLLQAFALLRASGTWGHSQPMPSPSRSSLLE